MRNIKNLSFVLCAFSMLCIAMQETLLPLVRIQKADDAAQFAGQVVAYTPVIFIKDFHTYREKPSTILNPALRYGYVSQESLYDESNGEWEKCHLLTLLVTLNIRTYYHEYLVTRNLKLEKLYMRKVTPKEAAYLLQILGAKKAFFEHGLAQPSDSGLQALHRANL